MLKIDFDGTTITVKEDDTVLPQECNKTISMLRREGDFIGEMLLRAVAGMYNTTNRRE